MLRNYLKMALKVLSRRRFYTFISMFGITLTLAILLIVSAFWDHLVGAREPEVYQDRSLVVAGLHMRTKEGGTWKTAHSMYFLEEYVAKLQTPELITFYSFPQNTSIYQEGQKVEISQKFTDATFWQVMKHRFVEGRPYSQDEVLQKQPVIVLSRELKEELLGMEPAAGKILKVGDVRYKVIGVIENTPITRIHSYGTMFIPHTLNQDYRRNKQYNGNFFATLVAKDKESVAAMQQEYNTMAGQVTNPDPNYFESIHTAAEPYVGAFSRMFLGQGQDSGVEKLYAILFVLAFLFMLLPTINLMNINISRMMERASEIGVRKAFGASTTALLFQFVLENLVLTLLSGLLAVAIAWLALLAINQAALVNYMMLSINLKVLWWGLLFTLVFGLFSGIYPAWRMSKLPPAEALRGK